jgi:ligand-binding sensor domain-containing protein
MNRKSNSLKRIYFLFILISLFFSACVKTENAVDPLKVKLWETYTTSDGLADNSVWSLFEDKDGNIWIGTYYNGVSKFDGNSWTNYNTSDGLLQNSVLAISQDRDGDMWFGTQGGLSVLHSGEWINIPTLGGYNFDVYSLLRDSRDNMWMGTDVLGLIKYDYSQWLQYFDNQCPDCNTINDIIEDRDKNIWYGSDADLKKLSGGNISSYTTTNGLPGGSVQALHQDLFGNIWVGTYGGEFVAKYTGNTFKAVSLCNAFNTNYTTSISSDKLGNIWFGLIGGGRVEYTWPLMKTYMDIDGNQVLSVMCILKDSKGSIWFGTLEDGVIKYTPRVDM